MNGNSLQIILVIIVTAVAITVVDNLLGSVRSEQAAIHREALTNQTLLEQERHHNSTEAILESLTGGVNRQEDVIARLDQIIGSNTTSSP